MIENQLESTNHDHLGKIITYASGLDAAVVVWIVAEAREEHASAIEWLNKHTDEEVSFFLLEIHAYTIGDSMPAPQFHVIQQPNDFARTARNLSHTGGLTEAQTHRLEFWTKLNDEIDKRGKPFNKHKASPDHWYTVAVGSSQCHISIDLVNKERKIRVGLWISDNKDLFDTFMKHRDEIESAARVSLDWDRMNGKKASAISTNIPGLNFSKQDNYPELMTEVIETVLLLKNAFAPFIG